MIRPLFATAMALVSMVPNSGHATETWCGVFDRSSDTTLNLRAVPNAGGDVVARVTKSELLFIDTGQCRAGVCTNDRRWVYVEAVKSHDPGKTDIKGWANSRFIREIACPD